METLASDDGVIADRNPNDGIVRSFSGLISCFSAAVLGFVTGSLYHVSFRILEEA